MNFLQRFMERIRVARQHRANKSVYKAELMAAIVDGVLTADEIQRLDRRARDLGLSREEIGAFRVGAYLTAFNAAKGDGTITAQEEEELSRIKAYLGVQPGEVSASDRELARFRLLREIQEGHMPATTVPGLITQKGESAYWAEPASILEERVVRREYVGGSHGVSFRIMKGVSYRVGAQRGQFVSTTGVVPVSSGQLVVTSKRIIFLGSKKGFNIRLDKAVGLELHSDGLTVTDGAGKPRVVQFAAPGNADIVGAILSYAVNNFAS